MCITPAHMNNFNRTFSFCNADNTRDKNKFLCSSIIYFIKNQTSYLVIFWTNPRNFLFDEINVSIVSSQLNN